MLKVLFLLTACFIFSSALAQKQPSRQNELEKEIHQYQNKELQILQNGRQLLAESITKRNKAKALEITDYLEENLPAYRYEVFWPGEKMLLYFSLGRYAELIHEINQPDTQTEEDKSKKYYPSHDLLFTVLKDYFTSESDSILKDISTGSLEAEDKAFLIVTFQALKSDQDSLLVPADSVQMLAREFMTHHPNSKYSSFVQNLLPLSLMPAKWGFGFHLFTGGGFYTGKLKSQFSGNVSFGVAFEVDYKKYAFFFYDYLGFGMKNKQPLTYNSSVTWPKHFKVDMVFAELSAGRIVYESEQWRLIPFVGWAPMFVGPQSNAEEFKKQELNFIPTLSTGLIADYKIKTTRSALFRSVSEDTWVLRLRLGVNPVLATKQNIKLSGSLINFTIGIGGYSRIRKPVRPSI